MIRIHTLWKMWDDEAVELLFALDEYTVLANWDAWEAGIKAACERYGITEADIREVVIEVPYEPIAAAFMPVEVVGSVSESDSTQGEEEIRGAHDSPRWCTLCEVWGDHHTDRHADYKRQEGK